MRYATLFLAAILATSSNLTLAREQQATVSAADLAHRFGRSALEQGRPHVEFRNEAGFRLSRVTFHDEIAGRATIEITGYSDAAEDEGNLDIRVVNVYARPDQASPLEEEFVTKLSRFAQANPAAIIDAWQIAGTNRATRIFINTRKVSMSAVEQLLADFTNTR